MNAPTWVGVALATAAVSSGLLAFRQQSEIEILRGEAAALDAARSSQTVPQPPEVPSNSPPPGGDRLTEPEKLDLLRLRSEVTRLREQVRRLAGVRTQNQQLKARLQQPAHTDGQQGSPAGYQHRRDAQFAGYRSPEATIQSLLWATEHRDTNALFTAFDTAQSQAMRDALARDDGQAFWNALRVVPGWRIMSQGRRGADQAFLTVEFMPGAPPQDMYLRLVGNEWKISNNVEPPRTARPDPGDRLNGNP
jgi:hypothetical protein